jgi:hypothetical protein
MVVDADYYYCGARSGTGQGSKPGCWGDDYLTKPFGMAELLARIRVALRRKLPAEEGKNPPEPKATRLAVMRSWVQEHNIFQWSAHFLQALVHLPKED